MRRKLVSKKKTLDKRKKTRKNKIGGSSRSFNNFAVYPYGVSFAEYDFVNASMKPNENPNFIFFGSLFATVYFTEVNRPQLKSEDKPKIRQNELLSAFVRRIYIDVANELRNNPINKYEYEYTEQNIKIHDFKMEHGDDKMLVSASIYIEDPNKLNKQIEKKINTLPNDVSNTIQSYMQSNETDSD